MVTKQCVHSVGPINRQTKIVIKTLLLIPTLASLLLFTLTAMAADTTGVAAELDGLITKIQAKLKEGKKTGDDLATEFKEFDLLLARHKGEQTDALANVLVQEAGLYLRVFENYGKATQLIETLKRDFPRTTPGQNADKLLASISKHSEAKRLHGVFAVGTLLPDFEAYDLGHKPLSIAQYRGKVVLLDFGATWSKPWVAEVSNLRQLYENYHRDGFEIIGISLDEDQLRLSGFTTRNKLPWRQYFDGSKWNNKLAIKYGVNSLPANYLLDREGKIVAKNVRGKALEDALAEAMNRKSPQ